MCIRDSDDDDAPYENLIRESERTRARATRGYVIRHLDPYHYTLVSLPLFPGRGPLDS